MAAVIPELIWIIGFYAAAAALVHWAVGRETNDTRRPRHYVLVAGNHQLQIEGYVRALQQFSHWSGTEIGITVVLDNSTDETAEILKRFAREESNIDYVTKNPDIAETSSESGRQLTLGHGRAAAWEQVWVQLASAEDVGKLPHYRCGA